MLVAIMGIAGGVLGEETVVVTVRGALRIRGTCLKFEGTSFMPR